MKKPSHPKNAPPGLFPPRQRRGVEAVGQHAPRVRGRNDAVVPQAGGGEDGLALALDAGLELGVRGFADGFHDGAELVGAHDADLGVGPHPQEAWGVGAATDEVREGGMVRIFAFVGKGGGSKTYHIP